MTTDTPQQFEDPARATGVAAISYDEVPYPARAFRTTHPEHLATMATLLGLAPPPVETCRVLELGCATGGNLLPMAEGLPGAQFLGIDESRSQIEAARAKAVKSGVKNVLFRVQDLRSFGRTGERPELFDYIIAHGVYSWVPLAAREALLELCARHLSPRGIAYISYNTYPGWQVQSAIREMMLAHVWGSGAEPGARSPQTSQEVLIKAREVLDLLSAAAAPRTPHGELLRQFADVLRSLPEANLLHDHLGPINHPVYFSQFVAHAASKGLRYLADAMDPAAAIGMAGEGVEPEEASREQSVWKLALHPLRAEQFFDVLQNRAFRQSLLCRADGELSPVTPVTPFPPVTAAVNGTSPPDANSLEPSAWAQPSGRLNAGKIRSLFIGSTAISSGAEPEFGMPIPETFTTSSGATATIADALLKSAMRCLADAAPARVAFDALLESAWRRMGLAGGASGSDVGVDRLCGGLLRAYGSGIVELSVRPAPYATRVARRPVARLLARQQARIEDTVTTLRHENLVLNVTARRLLILLDGTRDRAALASAMEQILLENARNMDPTITLTDAERRELVTVLEQDLRRFADEGLLVG